MPTDIKAYRVFVASPGGLQSERNAFREALSRYNEMDGLPRGVMFLPVGWEDTLGGFGRPQHIINQDLRECDFMVLVLWDRWGSPPDRESRFRSGVEEEFQVAMECLRDSELPMQQIVVFFKAVHEKQLSDPGPQLQAVLGFKKSLEETKEHLFHTFDEVRSFDNLLSRHLASWVRAHEKGHPSIPDPAATATSTEIDLPTDISRETEPNSADAGLVAEALLLVEQGKRTDAEALFARAVVRGAGPSVLISYGDFLKGDGRLAQAAELYRRAVELAEEHGDEATCAAGNLLLGNVLHTHGSPYSAEQAYRKALNIYSRLNFLEGMASAYAHLGIVSQRRGDLDDAEQMYRMALEVNKGLGNMEGVADAHINLGLVFYMRGDLDDAETMYREALDVNKRLGRQEWIAGTYANLGLVRDTRGDIDGAELMHRKALEIYVRLDQPSGMAASYGNLGNVFDSRGDVDNADKMYHESLKIYERLGRLEGVARSYGNLGRMLYQRGDLDGAEQMHRKALELNDRLGRVEGMANAYGNLGNLLVKRGDLNGAEQMYLKTLEIADRMGWSEGIANSYNNLGKVLDAQGNVEGARNAWSSAAELYKRIGAAHLKEQMRTYADPYCERRW